MCGPKSILKLTSLTVPVNMCYIKFASGLIRKKQNIKL